MKRGGDILTLLTLLASLFVQAQVPMPIDFSYTTSREVANLLVECDEHCSDSSIIDIADRLERVAIDLSDTTTIAIAKAYKAYYYITFSNSNDLDSIAKYYNRAKDFCRETGQFTLYYWMWGYRIMGLMNSSYNQSALSYESKEMFQDIIANGSKDAIISAYLLISKIYERKGDFPNSIQFTLFAMDVATSYGKLSPAVSFHYALLARKYFLLDMPEEAKEFMLKAEETASTPNAKQYVRYCKAFANAYEGDYDGAIQIFATEGDVITNLTDQQRKEDMLDICFLSKHYLEAYLSIVSEGRKSMGKYQFIKKELIKHFEEMNIPIDSRIEHFQEYLETERVMNLGKENMAFIEEAVAYVTATHLGRETNDISKTLESEKFKFTRYINLLAIIILVYIILCSVYLARLNKNLTYSIVEISRTNNELIRKRDELDEKKQMVMEEQRKKEEFMRNVCHEIRTPLNAIDGFSCVISEQRAENANIQDIAGAISDNSDRLLDIIDSTVEKALLDTSMAR